MSSAAAPLWYFWAAGHQRVEPHGGGNHQFGGIGYYQVFPQTSDFSLLSNHYLIQLEQEGWNVLFIRKTDYFPNPWMDWVRWPFLAGIFCAASHSVLGFSRIPVVNPELHLIPSLSERYIRSCSRAHSLISSRETLQDYFEQPKRSRQLHQLVHDWLGTEQACQEMQFTAINTSWKAPELFSKGLERPRCCPFSGLDEISRGFWCFYVFLEWNLPPSEHSDFHNFPLQVSSGTSPPCRSS